MKNLNKRGGKRMLPTCCLPLWGRVGVTLLAAAENKRISGKRGFQQSPLVMKIARSSGRLTLKKEIALGGEYISLPGMRLMRFVQVFIKKLRDPCRSHLFIPLSGHLPKKTFVT